MRSELDSAHMQLQQHQQQQHQQQHQQQVRYDEEIKALESEIQSLRVSKVVINFS